MNSKENGFSALELTLAAGVVLLAACVGWMYFSNMSTTKNVVSGSETTQTPSSQKNVSNDKLDNVTDIPLEKQVEKKTDSQVEKQTEKKKTEWITYQPAGKQYVMKVADGWMLRKKGDGASLYSEGSLALREGIPGKVLNASTNAGHIPPCDKVFLVLDYLDYAFPDKYRSKDAQKLTTNEGMEVEKTVRKDTTGVSGYATSYSYIIIGKGEHINIGYSKCPGHADHHVLVEKVLKTIQLK